MWVNINKNTGNIKQLERFKISVKLKCMTTMTQKMFGYVSGVRVLEFCH